MPDKKALARLLQAIKKTESFNESVSRGAIISELIDAGSIADSELSPLETMDVYTYQFNDRWLSRYKMEDISWIARQSNK